MLECLDALLGCFFPVGSRSGTVVRRLDPIGGRPRPVAFGPDDDVVGARVRVTLQIVQTSQRITSLRAAVTKCGGAIAIIRSLNPPGATLVTQLRHGFAVVSRSLARNGAPLIGGRVATGRELIVGGVLIVVRASLVALTGRLVVIRPRLILITRRLIAI